MREISILKENILKYLEFKGISKYEFYQKTGVSNGILSQKNGLSEDNIMRFLSYYTDVNPTWLLTGKGFMIKENNVVADAITLNEPGEAYTRLTPSSIPFVSVTAIGGFGSDNFAIQQEDIKEYYVIPKFKHKKIDFMIEVEGSSMYPKYNSGDVVACTIIKESSFIQWNKTHVIATREQGIIIKRLKKSDVANNLIMISDNPSYDPFEVVEKDILGIALVVGVIRLE